MDPVVIIRDQAWGRFYERTCSLYTQYFGERSRKLLEIGVLICAILAILLWMYVHLSFFKYPSNCFESVDVDRFASSNKIVQIELFWNSTDTWNILRVEIQRHQQDIVKMYKLQFNHASQYRCRKERTNVTDFLAYFWGHVLRVKDHREAVCCMSEGPSSLNQRLHFRGEDSVSLTGCEDQSCKIWRMSNLSNRPLLYKIKRSRLLEIVPEYNMIEFSQKYGYLSLSQEDRIKLNLPTVLYTLDLNNVSCFGGYLGQFLHNNFLGFHNTLVNSLAYLMENDTKGAYIKDGMTGSYYYVQVTWMSRMKYFMGVLPLVFFTMITSAFIRQSQYQIFKLIFVFHQMLRAEDLPYPLTAIGHMPLLTMTYACVGLVVVMSEMLTDGGFFCLLMLGTVWQADQYFAIFCNSRAAKKYWPRFFYLYHFIPYAFYIRLNGNYWLFPFIAHWLLLFHSMLFFFNRYELPRYLERQRNQQTVFNVVNELGVHLVAIFQQPFDDFGHIPLRQQTRPQARHDHAQEPGTDAPADIQYQEDDADMHTYDGTIEPDSSTPNHPAAGPTHPAAGPTHPAAGPIHPAAGPTHPAAGPTHPAAGPTQSSNDPTYPSTGGPQFTEESTSPRNISFSPEMNLTRRQLYNL